LFPQKATFDLTPLADALSTGWSDPQAAALLKNFHEMLQSGKKFDTKALARWARHHPDDSDAVLDCMRLDPPEEIEVIKVLSRKGSQKLVFLAKWRLTLQEVVLKQIISTGESAEKIISRELQSSPLSIVHPNIIETHFLRNPAGERFLVERRLTEVLHDDWDPRGTYEAANLLFDAASAIKFLHDHNLVHGDVKPDNIGKKGSSYVLLDFGICRAREEFTREATATGSLRTRAPELLLTDTYVRPEAVDVWALGATIYKFFAKRLPLIGVQEEVPRISSGNKRNQFEEILRERVVKEWDKWVDLNLIPETMRDLLERMLNIDPKDRISSTDLIPYAEKSLSAFLRSSAQANEYSGRFSPLDELNQIAQYLDGINSDAALVPRHKRQTISARLRELESIHGFGEKETKSLKELLLVLDS
jgi:serine/threonine protein kinase